MSLVKKYSAEVVSLTNHFDNIFSAEFKSLSGKFRYSPGQFLHLALDEYDPSSGWPESRCFSIQTSPYEQNIKITFSVKGKFTARMAAELRNGKVVNLKLPYGELFQNDHPRENVVFIAGGTGVTPFLSLYNDPSFSSFKAPVLYLGIREEKYNIYQKEILLAEKMNPSFRVKIICQNSEGPLDIESIYSYHGNGAIYYISGPQIMISSFKSRLCISGVVAGNIKTDEWQ